jgi:hypothetical protein
MKPQLLLARVAMVWAVSAATILGNADIKPVSVQLEMKNVRLHVDDGIVLDVTRLRGVMVSRVEGTPPVFDDQRSYVLRLQSGELSMDMASLTNLMNRHVFAFEGSPLKDVSVESDGARLRIKGKLHKGIDVPFSATASVSTTADGRMGLHVESMKALGIPAKGLLEVFGLKMEDVLDLKARRGVDVQDNDIVIAAGQVLPPPEIAGRLTRAVVQRGRLLQSFDDSTVPQPARSTMPSRAGRNYVYFSGGVITFGKLTMRDADLQLIDADPKDAFDFFPARYKAQLVAGYSKNTPAMGLRTYMPDFDDLAKPRR